VIDQTKDAKRSIIVILQKDDNPAHMMFRCVSCGKIVFELSKGIYVLMVGRARPEQVPLTVQCPHEYQNKDGRYTRCKTRYDII